MKVFESTVVALLFSEAAHARFQGMDPMDSVNENSIEESRNLVETGGKVTERCFTECVEQNMTEDECVQYIKGVLGDDLSNHEVPDLQLKVVRPASTDSVDENQRMFAVYVNLFGEVRCDINGGVVTYNNDWETSDGVYRIPDVPCTGLLADECCAKVLTTVENEGIPLTDINGNCLSCWVHQAPLEPVVADGGTVTYIEQQGGSAGQCGPVELSKAEVQAEDDATELELSALSDKISQYMNNGATCVELSNLQKELLVTARFFGNAQLEISDLLCGYCNDTDGYAQLPEDLIFVLQRIQTAISGEIKSDVNCLTIYVDGQGFVTEPPKIGNGQPGMDLDENDPDCEDEEAPVNPNPDEDTTGTPTGPEGPTGNSGCDTTVVCKEGQFKSQDCQCTDDLDLICPPGTYVQQNPLRCVGCNCGFCQSAEADFAPCCETNARGNNCKPPGKREKNCIFQQEYYFPGYGDQQGDSCSGVEVGPEQVSVGCGCKPSSTAKCTYNPDELEDGKQCYICTTDDLASNASNPGECSGCKDCLINECSPSWKKYKSRVCRSDIFTANDVTSEDWKACLETSSNDSADCSLKCSSSCFKKY